jgi:hypothetical protein
MSYLVGKSFPKVVNAGDWRAPRSPFVNEFVPVGCDNCTKPEGIPDGLGFAPILELGDCASASSLPVQHFKSVGHANINHPVGDFDTKSLLLYGAIGLGVCLLFFKKRKPMTTRQREDGLGFMVAEDLIRRV